MIEELRKVKEICEQESKKKVSAQKNASYLRLELQRRETKHVKMQMMKLMI